MEEGRAVVRRTSIAFSPEMKVGTPNTPRRSAASECSRFSTSGGRPSFTSARTAAPSTPSEGQAHGDGGGLPQIETLIVPRCEERVVNGKRLPGHPVARRDAGAVGHEEADVPFGAIHQSGDQVVVCCAGEWQRQSHVTENNSA
jgi:hypothetical protein